MSIRDIVRRERWEMNRCAHEAELMLLGVTTDVRDEGDAWHMIIESYETFTISDSWRRALEHLFR
jgi:hypothetical protein